MIKLNIGNCEVEQVSFVPPYMHQLSITCKDKADPVSVFEYVSALVENAYLTTRLTLMERVVRVVLKAENGSHATTDFITQVADEKVVLTIAMTTTSKPADDEKPTALVEKLKTSLPETTTNRKAALRAHVSAGLSAIVILGE
ncbi:MAG: hypothetical protein [Bacteriophage sp.]|nr:MAG: hypothetical protein [Bacteriophage sp.]